METKEEDWDLYFVVRSTPFTYVKLAIGTPGQYLKARVGEPSWKEPSIDADEFITEYEY